MKQVAIYYLIGVAVFVIAGLLVYIGVASDVEAIYVALAAVAPFRLRLPRRTGMGY